VTISDVDKKIQELREKTITCSSPTCLLTEQIEHITREVRLEIKRTCCNILKTPPRYKKTQFSRNEETTKTGTLYFVERDQIEPTETDITNAIYHQMEPILLNKLKLHIRDAVARHIATQHQQMMLKSADGTDVLVPTYVMRHSELLVSMKNIAESTPGNEWFTISVPFSRDELFQFFQKIDTRSGRGIWFGNFGIALRIADFLIMDQFKADLISSLVKWLESTKLVYIDNKRRRISAVPLEWLHNHQQFDDIPPLLWKNIIDKLDRRVCLMLIGNSEFWKSKLIEHGFKLPTQRKRKLNE
jgi:hypothetical protein